MNVALTLRPAREEDAGLVSAIRAEAARSLTARFGAGHWSTEVTERGVLSTLRHSRIWLGWDGDQPIATFRLGTRKPWAIDRAYFTPVGRPLYLTDMAVRPDRQGGGVGRWCLERVAGLAREWPADAVCLDAYDADAGAGPFYARCGYGEVGRALYRGVPLVYFELLLH